MSAGDILQALATLVGAIGGLGMIAWQVNAGFANDRKLRHLDRMMTLRDELVYLPRIIKQLKRTAELFAAEQRRKPEKAEDPYYHPFSDDQFKTFKEDFGKFNDAVIRSEQPKFLQCFYRVQMYKEYIVQAISIMNYTQSLSLLDTFVEKCDELLTLFDESFPKSHLEA